MFLESFKLYVDNLSDKNEVYFNISCDIDDVVMNNEITINKIKSIYNNTNIVFNNNKNKIEAINAGIDNKDFDVILNASDDMNPQIKNFDEDIRIGFEQHFPDYDGVLHFNERFGYIYHPDYHSLWCDNEFMEVSKILNRVVYIDKVIVKHDHATFSGNKNSGKVDETYARGFTKNNRDQQVFNARKSLGFPIERVIKDD